MSRHQEQPIEACRRLELMSRQEIDVATSRTTSSKLHRLNLMSRREIDVATWIMSRQRTRGRDLNSNMGQSI